LISSPCELLLIEGLYVLKTTDKKSNEENSLSIPSSLTAYIMRDFPPSTCPWSLSGPQFPHPTPLQQRYCYPKCDSEYACKKGGSLWTIISDNGKEDLTYRLLHIYFSEKRANTGTSPMFVGDKKDSSSLCLSLTDNAAENSALRLSPQEHLPKESIVLDNFSFSNDLFAQGFGMIQQRREDIASKTFLVGQSTPRKQSHACSTSVPYPKMIQRSQRGRRHQSISHVSSGQEMSRIAQEYYLPSPSIEPRQYHEAPLRFFPTSFRPIRQKNGKHSSSMENVEDDQRLGESKKAKHVNCVTPSTTEIAMLEFEAYWTDPLLLDQSLACKSDQDSWTNAQRIESFETKLSIIHTNILEKISEAPCEIRENLVGILSSWASYVAKYPLNSSQDATKRNVSSGF
jgi:hypothetical protein